MVQQENYDWIKAFKEIKEIVKGYRHNQQALIDILKDVGIAVPDDENPKGTKIPLEQIDPFSFLSLINKFPNVSRRAEFVNKILGHDALDTDVENFSGVPTAHGTAALFFPYKYHRKPNDVDSLWNLFECMDDSIKIDPQLFEDVLFIHSVGFSKLTQGLFWYAPEQYLPIDGQTALYLENITLPKAYKIKNASTYSLAWQEYQSCLTEIRKNDSKPFYKVSFDAWIQNGKKYSAEQAIKYLESRYGSATGSTHIKVFRNPKNRELALDPNLHSAKVFIEAMPPVDFFNNIDRIYGIAEKRNQHLDTYSEHLGITSPTIVLKISNEGDLESLCDWYEQLDAGSLRERIDHFLLIWPLESIQKLKLKDYYHVKQFDCFARWLDLFDVSMGATYGNNFHVWRFLDKKKEQQDNDIYKYLSQYAWEKSFGNTIEEAFETVKDRVLKVAELAKQGDFEQIEMVELNLALKWKIAFIYQNFSQPKIYPIFSKEDFKRAGYGEIIKSAVFSYLSKFEHIEKDRGQLSYFEYVERLHEKILDERAKELGQKHQKKIKHTEGNKEMKKSDHALNRILFGAAGTGKTYNTINHALAILDNKQVEDIEEEEKVLGRQALKARFDKFKVEGRIEFVTFHQSFSYEDFVEGIRAETKNGNLTYDVKSGVFKEFCELAKGNVQTNIDRDIDLTNKKIWKMSLGRAGLEDNLYQSCLDNNVIVLGWGDATDFSACDNKLDIKQKLVEANYPKEDEDTAAGFVNTFKNKIRNGDLVVITDGNLKFRAIAEVTGDYEYDENQEFDYHHIRSVKWLKSFVPSLKNEDYFKKGFSQPTVYNLENAVDKVKLTSLLQPRAELSSNLDNNYVFIIDEINRGNISRIFGELITLVEESKREGADEALSVTLPYLKEEFSIPANVYLIGTMNSSDRSLTGLDVALRRRFTFIEMPPKPLEIKNKKGDLLKISGKDKNGNEVYVIVADLLSIMNQRIEVLLDRDHCIGHAIFMSLKENPTLEYLADIFKQKIIPQLQEYFFDDWAKINLVLFNNGMLVEDDSLKMMNLFPSYFEQELGYSNEKKIWKINAKAFESIDAFHQILGSKG